MEACTSNGVVYSEIDIAFVDKNVEGSVWTLEKTVQYLKAQGIPKVIIATGESAKEISDDPASHLADGIAKEKIPKNIEELL